MVRSVPVRMIGPTLSERLRQHRTAVLTVVIGGQLVALVMMPQTLFTLRLLGRAIMHGYAGYMLIAPVLLFSGQLFNRQARALNWRWLEWSPWGVRTNLALTPMKLRFLWLPYALVLGCCIPLLAFFEEEIFRNGTHDWLRGLLWGGIAFGLIHLISCVTLRMTIYLSLVGVALVGIYMHGGLLAVFVTHASYNLLVLAMVSTDQHLPQKLRAQLGRALPIGRWCRALELGSPTTVIDPTPTTVIDPVTEPRTSATETQDPLAAIAGVDFPPGVETSALSDAAALREEWPNHPRPTRQSSAERVRPS